MVGEFMIHRFLLITRYFYPSQGACSVRMDELTNGLIQTGNFNIDVLTADLGEKSWNDPRGFSVNSRDIGNIPKILLKFESANPLLIATWALWAVQSTRRHRPAIILATSPPLQTVFAGMVASKLFGTKLVLDLRDDFSSLVTMYGHGSFLKEKVAKSVGWILNKLVLLAGTRANFLSVVEPEIGRDLMKESSLVSRVIHVPNGINRLEIQTVRRNLNVSEVREKHGLPDETSARYLIYVGNLDQFYYRPDIFVMALPYLLERNIDARVVVVGQGVLQDNIRDTAEKLGVNHRIHLLGSLPHDEVISLNFCCDVGLYAVDTGNPQDMYAIGVKTFEYLSTGLPVCAVVDHGSRIAAMIGSKGAGETIFWDTKDEESIAREVADGLEILLKPGQVNHRKDLVKIGLRFDRKPGIIHLCRRVKSLASETARREENPPAVEGLARTRTSVVICTMDTRNESLKEAISSINNQTVLPEEIIVVRDPPENEHDNRSIMDDPGSRPPIRIITSDMAGLSSARNKGVEVANGNLVAFIDDDAVADPRWLENLNRHFLKDDVAGVGGRVMPMWGDGKDRPSWLDPAFDWLIGCSHFETSDIMQVENPTGCSMVIRKDIIERTGPFRTDIGRKGDLLEGCEESELGRRILKTIPGSVILHDPDSLVHHQVPEGRRRFTYGLKRAFREGISKAKIAEDENEIAKPERKYFTILFSKRIPTLIATPKVANLQKAFASILFAAAVTVGFTYEKINNRD